MNKNMRMIKEYFTRVVYSALLASVFIPANGQYPVNYHYTLLPVSIADEILAASSGDLALQHITMLTPYTRTRNSGEFPDRFRESNYVMKKLEEYGIENRRADKVGKTQAWRATEGRITEISPGKAEIADISDLPEMLAEGSKSTSVRAKLIWAGEGQPSFFADNKQNIKDKIVVTSANLYAVHSQAMRAGAVGTISFFSSRAMTDPVQIPNSGIYGEGFAFMLPPREGILLRDRLARRENIEAEVIVKTTYEQADLIVPQCLIPGTDTTAGEIIFTAHLFEGFTKMGANDNMSGSAVLIEVAHLLNNLITQGKIQRPVRSIRFLWVPEFSGTIPWVNAHLTKVRNAMCNINLDMVGINLKDNRSFLCLHRSGYSTAHFANDVMENLFRYVGETNVEGITDDLGRRGFSKRIVSPTGTDDPFYYRILTLHGSSDNAVFNDWGVNIPGIKIITWPDSYYHSSEDTPDKCDPTQLRRVIFICAAGAYTLASAGDQQAIGILSEVFASATERLGIEAKKSSDMIIRSDSLTLPAAYKRAASNIEGATMALTASLESVRQVSAQQQVVSMIASRKEKLNDQKDMLLASLKELMTARCRHFGLPVADLRPDDSEKAAGRIIPVPTVKAETMGYGGDRKFLLSVPSQVRQANPYNNIFNTDEVAGLADGKRTVMQIKKIVDAEFESETPLQDIVNYFTVLREAGLMQF